MGLRPTPRLGLSRGPLRPAPLPRGRAVRAAAMRHDCDILVWRRMTDYIVVCALELKVALR
jgi:hypothetical protein